MNVLRKSSLQPWQWELSYTVRILRPYLSSWSKQYSKPDKRHLSVYGALYPENFHTYHYFSWSIKSASKYPKSDHILPPPMLPHGLGHQHLSLRLLQKPPNGFFNFYPCAPTIQSWNNSPSEPFQNLDYVSLLLKTVQWLPISL